jgi:hypothetical protein
MKMAANNSQVDGEPVCEIETTGQVRSYEQNEVDLKQVFVT